MRSGRPWCFTNIRSGEGGEAVEAFVLQQLAA
jgi:urease accessory protein